MFLVYNTQVKTLLEEKIDKISNIFEISKIEAIKVTTEYIQRYYKVNQIPYSLFHSKEDLVHLGISRNGVFTKNDLTAQALFVNKYIKKIKAKRILELATGRGADASLLARKNPNSEFYGIDLSQGQLYYAYKKAKKVKNYFPSQGNYQDLSSFEDSSFSICFVVEALCYSVDKKTVLREVYRVLKKGGYFIVIDSYKSDKQLSSSEFTASRLTEKGMALDSFEKYSSFTKKAKDVGFVVELEEDVSKYVIPNMERLEKVAAHIFKHPHLAKTLVKILPNELVYNAISGYLMPSLIKGGVAKYYIDVLKKV